MICCPVCLVREKNGILEPVLLDRTQYLAHYEVRHSRNSIFASLGFSTGYGERMNEATVIYHLALAHMPEDGSRPAVSGEDSSKNALRDAAELPSSWSIGTRYCYDFYTAVEPSPRGEPSKQFQPELNEQPQHQPSMHFQSTSSGSEADPLNSAVASLGLESEHNTLVALGLDRTGAAMDVMGTDEVPMLMET